MQQSAMQGNYLRELEEEVVHPLPCWPILLFHLKLFVSFPINFTTAGIDVGPPSEARFAASKSDQQCRSQSLRTKQDSSGRSRIRLTALRQCRTEQSGRESQE